MHSDGKGRVAQEASWSDDADWRRLYWGAGASALGAGMLAFLAPLLVVRGTGPTHWGGVVGFGLSVLGLVTTLPGGAHADRGDRRRTLLVCSMASGIACLLGCALILAGFPAWPVFVGAVAASVVLASWSSPAAGAAVRSIVGPENLGEAKAWTQARAAVIRVVAAPLAGLLVGVTPWLCLLVAGVVELVEFFLIAQVPRRRLRTQTTRVGSSEGGGVMEGLRIVRSDRLLRGFVIFAAGSNLASLSLFLGANFFLLHRGVSPREIGVIDGVAGCAALVGAAAAPWLMRRVEPVVLLTVSSLLLAAGATVVALWPCYATMLVMLPLSRALVPGVNASVGGFVFARAADDMQGRLGASVDFCARATQPLAPVIAGFGAASRASFCGTQILGVVVLVVVTSPCARALRAARFSLDRLQARDIP